MENPNTDGYTEEETQRITLFMSPELVADIKTIAKANHRPKGGQMVFMLSECVKQYKDNNNIDPN